MNHAKKFNPESLRSLEYIFEPDPRNAVYVVFDQNDRPYDITDHYKAISQIELHASVPEDIAVQFETAKNLCLYAWFIYRFYPVAEHHAFTCLELALRTRYEKELSKKPGLKFLLKYAIDKGDIKNDGFQRWHEVVERRAMARYSGEKIQEMMEKGLKSIELDYSKVQITDVDRNIHYAKILLETLPEIRNHYAHGAILLHDQVLGTIELVSEIINQLYRRR